MADKSNPEIPDLPALRTFSVLNGDYIYLYPGRLNKTSAGRIRFVKGPKSAARLYPIEGSSDKYRIVWQDWFIEEHPALRAYNAYYSNQTQTPNSIVPQSSLIFTSKSGTSDSNSMLRQQYYEAGATWTLDQLLAYTPLTFALNDKFLKTQNSAQIIALAYYVALTERTGFADYPMFASRTRLPTQEPFSEDEISECLLALNSSNLADFWQELFQRTENDCGRKTDFWVIDTAYPHNVLEQLRQGKNLPYLDQVPDINNLVNRHRRNQLLVKFNEQNNYKRVLEEEPDRVLSILNMKNGQVINVSPYKSKVLSSADLAIFMQDHKLWRNHPEVADKAERSLEDDPEFFKGQESHQLLTDSQFAPHLQLVQSPLMADRNVKNVRSLYPSNLPMKRSTSVINNNLEGRGVGERTLTRPGSGIVPMYTLTVDTDEVSVTKRKGRKKNTPKAYTPSALDDDGGQTLLTEASAYAGGMGTVGAQGQASTYSSSASDSAVAGQALGHSASGLEASSVNLETSVGDFKNSAVDIENSAKALADSGQALEHSASEAAGEAAGDAADDEFNFDEDVTFDFDDEPDVQQDKIDASQSLFAASSKHARSFKFGSYRPKFGHQSHQDHQENDELVEVKFDELLSQKSDESESGKAGTALNSNELAKNKGQAQGQGQAQAQAKKGEKAQSPQDKDSTGTNTYISLDDVLFQNPELSTYDLLKRHIMHSEENSGMVVAKPLEERKEMYDGLTNEQVVAFDELQFKYQQALREKERKARLEREAEERRKVEEEEARLNMPCPEIALDIDRDKQHSNYGVFITDRVESISEQYSFYQNQHLPFLLQVLPGSKLFDLCVQKCFDELIGPDKYDAFLNRSTLTINLYENPAAYEEIINFFNDASTEESLMDSSEAKLKQTKVSVLGSIFADDAKSFSDLRKQTISSQSNNQSAKTNPQKPNPTSSGSADPTSLGLEQMYAGDSISKAKAQDKDKTRSLFDAELGAHQAKSEASAKHELANNSDALVKSDTQVNSDKQSNFDAATKTDSPESDGKTTHTGPTQIRSLFKTVHRKSAPMILHMCLDFRAFFQLLDDTDASANFDKSDMIVDPIEYEQALSSRTNEVKTKQDIVERAAGRIGAKPHYVLTEEQQDLGESIMDLVQKRNFVFMPDIELKRQKLKASRILDDEEARLMASPPNIKSWSVQRETRLQSLLQRLAKTKLPRTVLQVSITNSMSRFEDAALACNMLTTQQRMYERLGPDVFRQERTPVNQVSKLLQPDKSDLLYQGKQFIWFLALNLHFMMNLKMEKCNRTNRYGLALKNDIISAGEMLNQLQQTTCTRKEEGLEYPSQVNSVNQRKLFTFLGLSIPNHEEFTTYKQSSLVPLMRDKYKYPNLD